MNNITPEEFAYFIYHMSTQQSKEFFEDVKAVLIEKSQQEVEEAEKELKEAKKALNASIKEKKELNKLIKKM